MNASKLEMLSNKGIEKWIRKTLTKLNISHFKRREWDDESDAEMQLSPSLFIQIGDGYYSVVSTNDGTEKDFEKVAFHFEDGTGKLEEEIQKAIKAFPAGIVDIRNGGKENG